MGFHSGHHRIAALVRGHTGCSGKTTLRDSHNVAEVYVSRPCRVTTSSVLIDKYTPEPTEVRISVGDNGIFTLHKIPFNVLQPAVQDPVSRCDRD